ncbi:HdeA/HdeB family chaperone [Bosea sp. BE125]|uniref:HdeA/HdeB family chaperone n=1 Tax=Bosea sp. BE125 TaxID=2817909 RepID=UPI00286A19C3|nr:HdeA/HdeB family chaperone [Bosea sp. BE125]
MKQDSAALHNRARGLISTQIGRDVAVPLRAACHSASTAGAFCSIAQASGWLFAAQSDTLAPNRRLAAAAAPGGRKTAMVLPMQRSFLLAAALAASMLGGNRVNAEALDLMRATCADFVAMNGNDRNQLSLWLAGYYAGAAQRPLIDLDKIMSAPAELAALCAKTPQLPLVGAETRAVFLPTPAP